MSITPYLARSITHGIRTEKCAFHAFHAPYLQYPPLPDSRYLDQQTYMNSGAYWQSERDCSQITYVRTWCETGNPAATAAPASAPPARRRPLPGRGGSSEPPATPRVLASALASPRSGPLGATPAPNVMPYHTISFHVWRRWSLSSLASQAKRLYVLCLCVRHGPHARQARWLLIRLHPLYTIPGDHHVPPRATRAVYTSRGDTHAPDMKPP